MNKEEKERILQCVLFQIEKERTPRSRYYLKKMGAVILAAVVVFSCGAFTVKALDLDSRLEKVIGGNNEKIARAVTNLDAATEEKGIRIEAKQAVGDGHRVYILLEVTSLTDLTFDRTCSFQGFEMACSGIDNYGSSIGPANENISEGGKTMDMILEIASEEAANNQHISIKLKNFGKMCYVKESQQKVLIEGVWSLDFQLKYKRISETYRPDIVFTAGNGKLCIDRVDLSPISCFIEVSAEKNSADLENVWSSMGNIKLKMEDGTLVPLEIDGSSWLRGGKDSSGTMEGVFKEIINIDQAEKLIINDMEIPLY